MLVEKAQAFLIGACVCDPRSTGVLAFLISALGNGHAHYDDACAHLAVPVSMVGALKPAVSGSLMKVIFALGKLSACQEIGKIYNEFGKPGPSDRANTLRVLDSLRLYF